MAILSAAVSTPAIESHFDDLTHELWSAAPLTVNNHLTGFIQVDMMAQFSNNAMVQTGDLLFGHW